MFVRNLLEKKRKRRKGKEVLRWRKEEGESINKGRERGIRRHWSKRLEKRGKKRQKKNTGREIRTKTKARK